MGGCFAKKGGADEAVGPGRTDVEGGSIVNGEKLLKAVAAGGLARANFIKHRHDKLSDFYELESVSIGEGSYGSVVKGKNRGTQQLRAVKKISKHEVKSIERFHLEISIMKILDHPNIIKLYETFEDARNIYLIMELCTGGELFDRIVEQAHITEEAAATIMRQIFRAVSYMHLSHVMHRDLKPENFLFLNRDSIQQSPLKIIDFGLSCSFQAGQTMSTRAGTPYYVSPQVLQGKYTEACDNWSCGVIMYIMLCGYPPFYGENDQEVLSKVRSGQFQFSPEDWIDISADAKDLIRQLLKMNPKERASAEAALSHPWVKRTAPKGKEVYIKRGLIDNLRKFRSMNKLRKAALHVIAQQLSEDKIEDLRDLFLSLDANGDGMLSVEEIRNGIELSGLKDIPKDLEQVLRSVDADGSGEIDYTEWISATLNKKHYMNADVCWAAFRVFDRDGDGKISAKELREVLENDADMAKAIGGEQSCIEDIILEVDENGDGEIDFEEFMKMMRGKTEHKSKAGNDD